jgi:hypothetical protein
VCERVLPRTKTAESSSALWEMVSQNTPLHLVKECEELGWRLESSIEDTAIFLSQADALHEEAAQAQATKKSISRSVLLHLLGKSGEGRAGADKPGGPECGDDVEALHEEIAVVTRKIARLQYVRRNALDASIVSTWLEESIEDAEVSGDFLASCAQWVWSGSGSSVSPRTPFSILQSSTSSSPWTLRSWKTSSLPST